MLKQISRIQPLKRAAYYSQCQLAYQSSDALQQFGWDDWSNYLANDTVKSDYNVFRAEFSQMKKQILDTSRDPLEVDQKQYATVLGQSTVKAIVDALGSTPVDMPDMSTWQARADAMLKEHKVIAEEVDAFNEMEYQDAKEWAVKLDVIEANIDTVSVDQVLACFPETAQKIDDDIEEYWWRPEDKVEPGSHSHH